MNSTRIVGCFALLASFLCLLPAPRTGAQPSARAEVSAILETPGWRPTLVASYHGFEAPAVPAERHSADLGSGIREDIADKYKPRYERWKKEFLSTETGQKGWSSYANNGHFILSITITDDNSKGATTGKYKWDSSGQLIAATITLGSHIDEGYPNPMYFPVMNSLQPEVSWRIDQDTLADTKLAHEFGHVNRTAKLVFVLFVLFCVAS